MYIGMKFTKVKYFSYRSVTATLSTIHHAKLSLDMGIGVTEMASEALTLGS